MANLFSKTMDVVVPVSAVLLGAEQVLIAIGKNFLGKLLSIGHNVFSLRVVMALIVLVGIGPIAYKAVVKLFK